VEYGLGGRFCFTATGAEFKEIFFSTRNACLVTLLPFKKEFLSISGLRESMAKEELQ
jgi:hypothetical protein